MKRRTELRRGAPMKRGGRIEPKKRSAAERARIYGDGERATWMKAQPCVICGRIPSDSAHLTNGGIGRKDDASRTVPLCSDAIGYSGHHSEYDGGKRSFLAKYGVDLGACAERVERSWVAYQEDAA